MRQKSGHVNNTAVPFRAAPSLLNVTVMKLFILNAENTLRFAEHEALLGHRRTRSDSDAVYGMLVNIT